MDFHRRVPPKAHQTHQKEKKRPKNKVQEVVKTSQRYAKTKE
jgi:hypothetical protein